MNAGRLRLSVPALALVCLLAAAPCWVSGQSNPRGEEAVFRAIRNDILLCVPGIDEKNAAFFLGIDTSASMSHRLHFVTGLYQYLLENFFTLGDMISVLHFDACPGKLSSCKYAPDPESTTEAFNLVPRSLSPSKAVGTDIEAAELEILEEIERSGAKTSSYPVVIIISDTYVSDIVEPRDGGWVIRDKAKMDRLRELMRSLNSQAGLIPKMYVFDEKGTSLCLQIMYGDNYVDVPSSESINRQRDFLGFYGISGVTVDPGGRRLEVSWHSYDPSARYDLMYSDSPTGVFTDRRVYELTPREHPAGASTKLTAEVPLSSLSLRVRTNEVFFGIRLRLPDGTTDGNTRIRKVQLSPEPIAAHKWAFLVLYIGVIVAASLLLFLSCGLRNAVAVDGQAQKLLRVVPGERVLLRGGADYSSVGDAACLVTADRKLRGQKLAAVRSSVSGVQVEPLKGVSITVNGKPVRGRGAKLRTGTNSLEFAAKVGGSDTIATTRVERTEFQSLNRSRLAQIYIVGAITLSLIAAIMALPRG